MMPNGLARLEREPRYGSPDDYLRYAGVISNPRLAISSEPVIRKTNRIVAANRADIESERDIGRNDMQPFGWLASGGKVGDAVAMLDTPRGPATGFMVSTRLLMTNWHVFESVSQASDSRVRARFRWETGQDGFPRDDYQDVALDPASFFVCGDKTLDYALVALNNLPNGRPPGQKFGHLKLNGLPGKVLTGEPVNIIQHPQKSPKLISCRNSMLVEVDNEITVTYTSDTERGSSGSPVFNDQWQLVAIHARGVQETNSRGEVIDKQGNPIDDNGPEGDRSWVANEGIRVSAIVKHLEGMSLPPKEKRLLGNALRN